jgi:hypothetical protein
LTQERYSHSGHYGLGLANHRCRQDLCGASTDALLFGFGFTGGQ